MRLEVIHLGECRWQLGNVSAVDVPRPRAEMSAHWHVPSSGPTTSTCSGFRPVPS